MKLKSQPWLSLVMFKISQGRKAPEWECWLGLDFFPNKPLLITSYCPSDKGLSCCFWTSLAGASYIKTRIADPQECGMKLLFCYLDGFLDRVRNNKSIYSLPPDVHRKVAWEGWYNSGDLKQEERGREWERERERLVLIGSIFLESSNTKPQSVGLQRLGPYTFCHSLICKLWSASNSHATDVVFNHQLILLHKALVCLGKMQKRTKTLSLDIHSSLFL